MKIFPKILLSSMKYVCNGILFRFLFYQDLLVGRSISP